MDKNKMSAQFELFIKLSSALKNADDIITTAFSAQHFVVDYDLISKQDPEKTDSVILPFDVCWVDFGLIGYNWQCVKGRGADIAFGGVLLTRNQGYAGLIADTKTSTWTLRQLGDTFPKQISLALQQKDIRVAKLSSRKVFKAKVNSKKTQTRINNVIYVCNKDKVGVYEKELATKFSHKFWVSGHWRKILGKGKSFEGEYIEDNRTWVIEHVRGEDNMPLINKTRVVR